MHASCSRLAPFVLLSALLALPKQAFSTILIPAPSGPYDVGVTAMELVDTSRIDPYQPGNQSRAIMVSAFYPAAVHSNSSILCDVPYMPPVTAAFIDNEYASAGIPIQNGSFEQFQLQAACSVDECISSRQDFPVALFSPGLGVNRFQYSAIAQHISSNGFIVVIIDHPGDTDIVELSDGRIIYSALENATQDQIEQSVVVRSGDAQFVLDSLSQASIAKQLIPGSDSGLDVRRSVMYGHSLGGATSVATEYDDRRIIGACNLDGTMFGPVLTNGLPKDRFFLMFENPSHNESSDATIGEVLDNSRGWKEQLVVEGAVHGSFSDLPLLAELFGIQQEIEVFVGSVEGKRMLELLTRYLVEFFQVTLFGKKENLLKGPNGEFPEVVYLPS